MVQLTKEMIEDKLRQIAIHEKRFGECSYTRAMKKYCENERYRQNVNAFNKASKETIKHYLRNV